MTVIELVLSLVAILVAAFLFTNAVEILGDRLNLGQGAVGSVLAAVGIALPETMFPVVAILGAPFLLVTLAMFVAGVAAIVFQRRSGLRGFLLIPRLWKGMVL